jgi:hypothetical protein
MKETTSKDYDEMNAISHYNGLAEIPGVARG